MCCSPCQRGDKDSRHSSPCLFGDASQAKNHYVETQLHSNYFARFSYLVILSLRRIQRFRLLEVCRTTVCSGLCEAVLAFDQDGTKLGQNRFQQQSQRLTRGIAPLCRGETTLRGDCTSGTNVFVFEYSRSGVGTNANLIHIATFAIV